MKVKLVALALVVSILGGMVLLPVNTAVAAPGLIADVTGTFTDALGGTGTFVGQFELVRFVNQNGQLAAVGNLTGTLTDSLGNVIGSITQQITLLVDATGTCEILNLTLGPLDLDLLGLQVHLDQVHLEITAESGPGNLLGNLLCGIAGLLDSSGPLNTLVRTLNQLLRLF
jgi:hypothetical protein